MPGGMRGVRPRRAPGSGPCHGHAVARRVQRTTVSFATVPRRSPSVHRGARPVLGERCDRAGSTWPTDRALAPNLLPSTDVQHQGTVRWEGCGRRRPPRGSRRHREGWSGSVRQCRQAMPRLRRRGHQYLSGDGGIGPDQDPACEHVDRHQPAAADIRATAAASSGRYWSSIGPGPGTSAIAVAAVVLKTPRHRLAPRAQLASPAPRIAHGPPAPTIQDRGH